MMFHVWKDFGFGLACSLGGAAIVGVLLWLAQTNIGR